MTRSRFLVAALLPHLLPALLLACSSSSASSADGKDAGTADAPYDGVLVAAQDSYSTASGTTVIARTSAQLASAGALVGTKTYSGKLAGGEIMIPNVPEGAYELFLRSPPDKTYPTSSPFTLYLETSARSLDSGYQYTVRSDLEPMTRSSLVTLDLGLTVPWQSSTGPGGMTTTSPDDELFVFSRNVGEVGFIYAYQSPGAPSTQPVNGATSLPGLEIDFDKLYAYTGFGLSQLSSAKGDDVDILHGKTVNVSDATATGTPWESYEYTSAVESYHSPAFSLGDGDSTTLSGSFTPVTRKSFSLDYRGSLFNALFTDLPTQDLGQQSVEVSLFMEPGTPNPGTGGDAYLLDLTVFAFPPSCGVGCDTTQCPSGCSSDTALVLPGDEKQTFSYGNPFDYGQEELSLTIDVSAQLPVMLPGQTSLTTLSGGMSVFGPASDFDNVAIEPTISLPRNIRVNGATAPIQTITKGVGLNPTVSFEAPRTGTPTTYRVQLIQVDLMTGTGGATSTYSQVFLALGTSTQFQVPAGVMKSGSHYYFKVGADVSDGPELTKLNYNVEHISSATSFTGVFTP